MLELSPRMAMAAKQVRQGSTVADIGTDHAYLPAALILNGTCSRALACDLRRGPLSNAQKTVEAFGIADKVTLRLSDGFDKIEPFEADDFVLCGMGGTLMTQLISRTDWLKDESKRLILQPQSHAEDVRKYFAENGFEIITEDACEDSGKLYCAMTARYTGRITEHSPAFPYTGKLTECKKPEAQEYLIAVKNRLFKKYNAMLLCGNKEEAEKLKIIIDETEAAVNEMHRNGK